MFLNPFLDNLAVEQKFSSPFKKKLYFFSARLDKEELKGYSIYQCIPLSF